uniref:DUF6770 family protein n=1 Tax=Flavobacterium sp. TaxID=239 RepID=UPI00404ADC82
MKKVTFLILLFSTALFSQVQKLSALSKGKFIDSRVILEDNSEDVFGYILLYEVDRKSKQIYSFEYVVLDKNLNKITSNVFTQSRGYKNFIPKVEIKLSFVKKIKNELFFGLYDVTSYFNDFAYLSHLVNHRYRKINLENFTLSNEFVLNDLKKSEKFYQPEDKISLDDVVSNQTLIPLNKENFLIFSDSEYKISKSSSAYNKKIRALKEGIKEFYLLDSEMNIVWSKKINAEGSVNGQYRYRGSDKNVLVLQKEVYGKEITQTFNFEVFNINNGNKIGTLNSDDPNYFLDFEQMIISENEIVFYALLHSKQFHLLYDEKSLGYGKIILDKKTGKELRRDYFLWSNLNPHLTIEDEFGTIKNYGRLIVQNFIHLKNGNTVAFAEGYKMEMSTKVLDLFVLELDPEMKVKYYKKIDKNVTNFAFKEFTGLYLKEVKLFDYYYTQKLDKEENYVFFYNNNERDGLGIIKRLNPNWILGIITYVDGEFNYDKIQLTNKDSQIIPGLAKNGYIRLMEISQDDVELRLEKINY